LYRGNGEKGKNKERKRKNRKGERYDESSQNWGGKEKWNAPKTGERGDRRGVFLWGLGHKEIPLQSKGHQKLPLEACCREPVRFTPSAGRGRKETGNAKIDVLQDGDSELWERRFRGGGVPRKQAFPKHGNSCDAGGELEGDARKMKKASKGPSL